MNDINHEVTIIGGGPAGSTCALLLADFGFDVCLIEKKEFPRETLCGGFLSREVISILNDLGLFEQFTSLYPNKINHFRILNDNKNEISTELGFDAYGLKRSSFDNLILSSAKEKGAVIYQPAKVINLNKQNNKFKVKVSSTGNKFFISSDHLIAAYGKRNQLDKKLNRVFVNQLTKLNGIKFHADRSLLNNFNENEIQIYTSDNLYCGVNKVNDETVTLCFLEDRNELNLPVREQLLKLSEKNSFFDNLITGEFEQTIDNLSIYGTGNIYFGEREIVKDNVFMIGDAARVIAPLTGDGIGMAMQSAKILSEILFDVKRKKITINDSFNIYKNKWQNNFNKRLFIAGLIQKSLLKSFYRNPGLKFLKYFPGLLNYFVKNTRG